MMFLMKQKKLVQFQDDKLLYTVTDSSNRTVEQYDDNDAVVATWTETKVGDVWTRDKVVRS